MTVFKQGSVSLAKTVVMPVNRGKMSSGEDGLPPLTTRMLLPLCGMGPLRDAAGALDDRPIPGGAQLGDPGHRGFACVNAECGACPELAPEHGPTGLWGGQGCCDPGSERWWRCSLGRALVSRRFLRSTGATWTLREWRPRSSGKGRSRGNSPRRLSYDAVKSVFRRVAQRAHLRKKVTAHVLRHTVATTLLFDGCPIGHIKELLGHERLDTTCRYYFGVDVRAAKEAHRKFLRYE